ncbi:hypothetical protein K474DRAFT_1603604 [Panus rudis PR-1116 ss-1]|nr:hypothetical protein K474DRAFT_1603604 [Panus rudis PR-1116 ss-1]
MFQHFQIYDSCLTSVLHGQKPSHPGRMIQVGLSGGPRHAQVYSWAKSYTKKLRLETMILHDRDCIGASGIVWQLIKAAVPCDIMDHVEYCLEQEGFPRMATHNVAEVGFSFYIGDTKYSFTNVTWSPPEVYMTRGYCTYVVTATSCCSSLTVPAPY